MSQYPFIADPKVPFIQQASDWIADVFYELLPEAGFEVRDEQIYMAFQLERAYSNKATIFAEAGVGTGKTFVYLLYALCYAKYTRKPAIIACADESLIEQLVKPEGDLAKLAEHLALKIDARLGKSPDQYLCLNKLDVERSNPAGDELFRSIYLGLPDFVRTPGTLQAFYPYGDRKDYPHLTDEQWELLGWDVFQDCLVCSQRHRCGQTISRDHYRKSPDLIICSHDFYMEHVWTYEARKREGQLPLLPEHSSVVFDEGHLLETATQNALTYQLKHSSFEAIVTRLLQGEVRESFAVVIEEAIEASEALFELLARTSRKVAASDRKEVVQNAEMLRTVSRLRDRLETIEEELVFESGMHTLDSYQLRIVEEHIEMIGIALALFEKPKELICWVTEDRDEPTLVLMPKRVKEVLQERVFAQKMPVVFSSATLSTNDSFDYISGNLGIGEYLSFSVPSPYDYKEQMEAVLFPDDGGDKVGLTLERLAQTGGRALILFPSHEELQDFQREMNGRLASASDGYRFLYEGSGEISHLISQFQHDETSVLCAVTLWEGLDIPGPSLSHVIIWELPYPPHDPVFSARRADALHPFEEVDLPYMMLRLRQGIGRLIRSREDRGMISIMGKGLSRPDVVEKIRLLLPVSLS